MNPYSATKRRVLAAAACLCASGAALAQPSAGASPDAFKAEITAGMLQGTQGILRGNLVHASTDPYVELKGSYGRWYAGTRTGLGYNLVSTPQLTLGLGVNYMLGRYVANEPRYQGLGDVSGTATWYAQAEWRPIPEGFSVYGDVARSTRQANGTQANLGTTLALPLVGQLAGFADLKFTWGDGNYNQTFYGVTTAQSAASAYAPYAASAGFNARSLALGLYYPLTPHWSVVGFAGRSQFTGSVANSPVVASKSLPLSAVLATYKF